MVCTSGLPLTRPHGNMASIRHVFRSDALKWFSTPTSRVAKRLGIYLPTRILLVLSSPFLISSRDCGARPLQRLTSKTHPALQENRDKVKIFLAYGATRMEACRPIIIEALRLALTPSINSMRLLDFQVYCFAFSDTFSSAYSELSPSRE